MPTSTAPASWPRAREIAVAALCVAAALGLRGALEPWLRGSLPYATLYGALAAVVWVAGWRVATGSAVVGFLAADLLFVAPHDLGIHSLRDAAAALAFSSSAGLVILLGEVAQRARRRSAAHESALLAELAERRAAETRARAVATELQERLEEQRALLDILPTGVFIGDARCERIVGNAAGYAMLGLDAGANVSVTPGAETAAAPPLRCLVDGREMTAEELPMQRVARTGVALRGFEHDVELPDGRLRTVRANVTPLLGPDGKVRGVLGAYSDVTEQRRQERELRESDRRKTEFIATLSHELRNPLAAIQHAVEILAARPAAEGTQAWSVEVLQRQVSHLVHLLDDLLDVSRIALGRFGLRRRPIDLRRVLEQALEVATPRIAAARHRLHVALGDDPMVVDGDPERLAQAFGNLLANAAKFTPEGGNIALTACVDGEAVVVSVRDDGIGMERDEIATAFEMFAQLPDPRRDGAGGLGIGLTLARRLVELHDGSIEARSGGRGQGAEVLVRLPLLPAAEAVTPKPSSVAPSSGALRILVVDDNVDAAEGLATLLQLSGGHDTAVAHDGERALELMASARPQVVLLDIGLPGIDGYEVARRARGAAWGGGLKLVALTGFGQTEDRDRATAAGFDAHLTKPVDLATLQAALARLG